MGIRAGGFAVGRPAGMTDARVTGERRLFQLGFEVLEFALGAAAREVPAFERSNARRVVATIFQPLQRIDQ